MFARHDLTKNPPFSNVDLISCRNVLPYFGVAAQKRAIDTFHYALRPGGRLFLAQSESLVGLANLFEPEDHRHKFFSRKPAPTSHFPMAAGTRGVPHAKTGKGFAATGHSA